MQELREEWGDSDDSGSDIDELNIRFDDGWMYDEDIDNGQAVQEAEAETQDQEEDEFQYHPGRTKLKDRNVCSLEASLDKDNYDR